MFAKPPTNLINGRIQFFQFGRFECLIRMKQIDGIRYAVRKQMVCAYTHRTDGELPVVLRKQMSDNGICDKQGTAHRMFQTPLKMPEGQFRRAELQTNSGRKCMNPAKPCAHFLREGNDHSCRLFRRMKVSGTGNAFPDGIYGNMCIGRQHGGSIQPCGIMADHHPVFTEKKLHKPI